MSKPEKKRSYLMTWNNYPENWQDLLSQMHHLLKTRYIIGGKEVGDEGTPHIQGHIDFHNACYMKAIHKKVKPLGIHFALKIPDNAAHAKNNRNYCKKDLDYTEWGTPPTQGKRTDLHDFVDAIKVNPKKRKLEIMEEFPAVYAKYPRFCNEYRMLKCVYKPLDWLRISQGGTPPNKWIYGPPGTGKSRPYQELSSMYPKMPNKWWDGYDGEETVLIDDLEPNHKYLGYHIKIWSDRYPFNAEFKGFCHKIRPKAIVITSNFSPEEIWAHEPKVLEAILDRFEIIHKPKEVASLY